MSSELSTKVMGDMLVSSLLLDKLVDVVLSAVLADGHLEDVGSAQQSLSRLTIGDHLNNYRH